MMNNLLSFGFIEMNKFTAFDFLVLSNSRSSGIVVLIEAEVEAETSGGGATIAIWSGFMI